GCGLMVTGNSLVWNPPYIPQGTQNLAGISGITLYDGMGGTGLQGETQSVQFQGPGGGPPGCFSCGGLPFVYSKVDPTNQSGGGSFGSLGLSFGEVLGTAADTTAAPEITQPGAGAALTLLAGTMAALCGRRRSVKA